MGWGTSWCGVSEEMEGEVGRCDELRNVDAPRAWVQRRDGEDERLQGGSSMQARE